MFKDNCFKKFVKDTKALNNIENFKTLNDSQTSITQKSHWEKKVTENNGSKQNQKWNVALSMCIVANNTTLMSKQNKVYVA